MSLTINKPIPRASGGTLEAGTYVWITDLRLSRDSKNVRINFDFWFSKEHKEEGKPSVDPVIENETPVVIQKALYDADDNLVQPEETRVEKQNLGKSLNLPYDRSVDGGDLLAFAQTKLAEKIYELNPEWDGEGIVISDLVE